MVTGRIRDFRSFGQCAGLALGGFALGAACSRISGFEAMGCALWGTLQWVGLDILRTAINVTIWQAPIAHPCQAASFLPQLLQNGTHVWALLGQVALDFLGHS